MVRHGNIILLNFNPVVVYVSDDILASARDLVAAIF
jgi:hypothetical protein